MGGRGAWAERNKAGRGRGNATLAAGGGGGGDVDVDSEGFLRYDGANVSNFSIVSADLTKGSWGNYKGTLAIRDADGKVHTSSEVKQGASRVTFLFKDFVIKLEGLTGWDRDQNGGDIRFLKTVSRADKKFFTKVLTPNKDASVKVDGTTVSVKALAAARAKPTKEVLTREENAALFKEYGRLKNKYRLTDDSYPDDTNAGHNTFIVNRKLMQWYDYGLD